MWKKKDCIGIGRHMTRRMEKTRFGEKKETDPLVRKYSKKPIFQM